MQYSLEEACEILSRTPSVLSTMLEGLPQSWTHANEGPDTWSPFDVVGHLIHAEKTNWLPRARGILNQGESYTFEPFDRTAMFEASQGKPLETLLRDFAILRKQSLSLLQSFGLTESDFNKTGLHPDFGQVTLRALLATWVVHDLSHIRQIVRTMAKQYESEVGPWKAYLSIFK